jgi:nicotinate-nucleotide pyrophosphorylase (carboxylating)
MATDIEIDNLLRQIIAEDIGCGDITTEVCINSDRQALGTLHIKQKGIIAGLPFLAALFHIIDSSVSVELLVPEGSYQLAGTAVAELKGPARALITGKRCAVDLLQHISGIANATAAYVRKVSACPCAILDTRKTRPGLRFFEKYAVRIGGGTNHRYN